MTDWRKRIENIVFRRTGKTLEGMVVGDAMEIVGEVCEWLDNQIGPGTLDDANGCAAPATGAVRPLSHSENYCGRCGLVDDHFEDCELHDPEAAPTKTLESLFNCAEPVDFEEIIALCKECSACECGAETARCGGHSAWCPKA